MRQIKDLSVGMINTALRAIWAILDRLERRVKALEEKE